MPSTIFTDFVTPVNAAWLNDVNTAAYITVPANTVSITAETSARIAADNLLAPLASPPLTGVPTSPTAAAGTNTTQIATTAFVLANPSGVGVGQTWQTVTRTAGTTYTNNTGKPIMLSIWGALGAVGLMQITLTIAGVALVFWSANSGGGAYCNGSAIIPNGSSYILTLPYGGSISSCAELR
jgi:hypothetical protein